jgi:predicted transcriptional regulator
MTREVVSVERMARLDEIADLFDAKAIKRVPVVDNGKLVGIVSRADLLRVLASGGAGAGSAGEVQDRAIRDTLLADLARQDWTHSRPADLVVVDCVVHLWGVVGSEAERQALRIAAENTPGVRAVADHTTVDPLFPVL